MTTNLYPLRYDLEFETTGEALAAMLALGLRRVPGAVASFVGTSYADDGRPLVIVARKSGEASFAMTETLFKGAR